MKIGGSKLYSQGDKADYIYIIRSGEACRSMKQYDERQNFMETETRKILAEPLKAHNEHSVHLVKNQTLNCTEIDLGLVGEMTTIGLIEAL